MIPLVNTLGLGEIYYYTKPTQLANALEAAATEYVTPPANPIVAFFVRVFERSKDDDKRAKNILAMVKILKTAPFSQGAQPTPAARALLLLAYSLATSKSSRLLDKALPHLITLKPDTSGLTGGFFVDIDMGKVFRADNRITYMLSQVLSSYSDRKDAAQMILLDDLKKYEKRPINKAALDVLCRTKSLASQLWYPGARNALIGIWMHRRNGTPFQNVPKDVMKAIVRKIPDPVAFLVQRITEAAFAT